MIKNKVKEILERNATETDEISPFNEVPAKSPFTLFKNKMMDNKKDNPPKEKPKEDVDKVYEDINTKDFKNLMEEFQEEISNIDIAYDTNPMTMLLVLESLNKLNDKVYVHFNKYKQLIETLTDKDFGIVQNIKQKNSIGSNEAERKKSAAEAISQAKLDTGEIVDYTKVISTVKIRYIFFENLLKQIEYKSRICNTMIGAMKIDASLTTN